MRKFNKLRPYLHEVFVPLAFLFVVLTLWNVPVNERCGLIRKKRRGAYILASFLRVLPPPVATMRRAMPLSDPVHILYGGGDYCGRQDESTVKYRPFAQ